MIQLQEFSGHNVNKEALHFTLTIWKRKRNASGHLWICRKKDRQWSGYMPLPPSSLFFHSCDSIVTLKFIPNVRVYKAPSLQTHVCQNSHTQLKHRTHKTDVQIFTFGRFYDMGTGVYWCVLVCTSWKKALCVHRLFVSGERGKSQWATWLNTAW